MLPPVELDDLKVGDYCEAMIIVDSPRSRFRKIPRRGRVVGIHGNIVQIQTRGRKEPAPIMRADIISAWRANDAGATLAHEEREPDEPADCRPTMHAADT